MSELQPAVMIAVLPPKINFTNRFAETPVCSIQRARSMFEISRRAGLLSRARSVYCFTAMSKLVRLKNGGQLGHHCAATLLA